jgi:S1-C subfamily serine protease
MKKTKRAVIGWLAVVALAVSVPLAALMLKPDLTGPPEIKQAAVSTSESIVKVTWLVRTSHGSGSGVAVTLPDGTLGVLTAAHVVKGEKVVVLQREARGPRGPKSMLMVKADVVKIWEEWDVALLRPWAPELLRMFSTLDLTAVKVGDDLLHAGSQFGSHFGMVVLRGHCIGLQFSPTLPDWPWKHPLDATDLSFRPGSSGGGVFNSAGRVVGICVGAADTGLGVYVPARDIVALLK